MKISVGEIWLVKSTYSWGQCLVEIIFVRDIDRLVYGLVLDAEKEATCNYFNIQLHKDGAWNFEKSDFIRKVE